jgi:hypothetical protein
MFGGETTKQSRTFQKVDSHEDESSDQVDITSDDVNAGSDITDAASGLPKKDRSAFEKATLTRVSPLTTI